MPTFFVLHYSLYDYEDNDDDNDANDDDFNNDDCNMKHVKQYFYRT